MRQFVALVRLSGWSPLLLVPLMRNDSSINVDVRFVARKSQTILEGQIKNRSSRWVDHMTTMTFAKAQNAFAEVYFRPSETSRWYEIARRRNAVETIIRFDEMLKFVFILTFDVCQQGG